MILGLGVVPLDDFLHVHVCKYHPYELSSFRNDLLMTFYMCMYANITPIRTVSLAIFGKDSFASKLYPFGGSLFHICLHNL